MTHNRLDLTSDSASMKRAGRALATPVTGPDRNRSERESEMPARPYSIPVSLLRQLLRLDHETGEMTYLARPPCLFRASVHQTAEHKAKQWNARYAGKAAFVTVAGGGYRRALVLGETIWAHHASFALFYGRWPEKDVIDHIDGDNGNNRPDNLREATFRENARNTKGRRNSSSQYCGVSWKTEAKLWFACCKGADGKTKNLGYFKSEVDAARAYDDGARVVHGEFARLNFPDDGGNWR